MKLLLCTRCGDMLALLVGEWTACRRCGTSRGMYTADGRYAVVDGPDALVACIGNASLESALEGHEDERYAEKGPRLKAWLAPPGEPTVGRPLKCPCDRKEPIVGSPLTGPVRCPCGNRNYDWTMDMHTVRLWGRSERAAADREPSAKDAPEGEEEGEGK